MSDQAKVEDLEVFRLFRAALLKFKQDASVSLSNAEWQIGRTRSWLEVEQMNYWQGQLRKRTEAVAIARDSLRLRKLYRDFSGAIPNAAVEEKALAQCLAAVEHAQSKIVAIKKWLPKLDKAADVYSGGVSNLNKATAVEIPQAIALLDRLAAALEEYVRLEASVVNNTKQGDTSEFNESMSRGEEVSDAPLSKTGEKPPEKRGDAANTLPPFGRMGPHIPKGGN